MNVALLLAVLVSWTGVLADYRQDAYVFNIEHYTGQACIEHFDCPPGMACYRSECVAGNGLCDSDWNCQPGLMCQTGYCMHGKGNCNSDWNCQPGTMCMYGKCSADGQNCNSDWNCNPGMRCIDETCTGTKTPMICRFA